MRQPKLLFIQLGFHRDYPDVSTLATTYNDGIYYVASFVQRELPDCSVDICQMMWGQKPTARSLDTYDFILISALATQFWSNVATLQELRTRKRPDCKIIMGGPHAAFAPYEALEYADYVVLGEGEIPTVQLLRCLMEGGDLRTVDNLCYLDDDGRLVFNSLVRYGNLNNTINPVLLQDAPRLHWATVSMSRGCPFNCSFCYAVRLLGRRFRTKDIHDVCGELDGIYEQTGCSRFYVTDLNFTTRKDFCYSVAEAVRGKGYKFIAMSRIDHADDRNLVSALRNAGFEEYCLGVESEDPIVLDAFNKKVDASLQTARLRSFAAQGIYTHSAIIFGLERQDMAAIERTARWCADARIVHPTFVCLAEYPFQNLLFGSRQDVEDHRIIMGVPTYQHYSFVGIFPRHMPPSRLQEGILQSYNTFFKRAFEIESRPQRRMRLKSYARSVAMGTAGMKRHAEFLRNLEQPYYTSSGTLREELLEEAFEERYGELRAWLARSIHRDPAFERTYAR